MLKEIKLEIAGLGILMYSPSFAKDIAEDEDFFMSHYRFGSQVAPFLHAGTLVSFGTASPGIFFLRFYLGTPDRSEAEQADFRLQLGLSIVDGYFYVRDVYELMEWTATCPPEQRIDVPNGLYRLVVFSNLPDSGIHGADQTVQIYLEMTDALPLTGNDVPTLLQQPEPL